MIKKKIVFIFFIIIALSPLFSESFENEYCSFTVPDEMEIEGGLYGDLKSLLSQTSSPDFLYSATLHQRGLNDMGDAYALVNSDYARIMITCSEGDGNTSEIDPLDLSIMDSIAKESLSAIYNIPVWNGIKNIKVKGYNAYVADYIRGSRVNPDNRDHVYSVFVKTEKYDWTFTFASEENSLSRWMPVFEEFATSFTFKDSTIDQREEVNFLRRELLKPYILDGTRKSFYWYDEPLFERRYINGIRWDVFEENHTDDASRSINIRLQKRTLGRSERGLYDKISYLFKMQRETGEKAPSLFRNPSYKVDRNTIDYASPSFVYQYSFVTSDRSVEGIKFHAFENNTLVVLEAEWDKNYEDVPSIIDLFVNQF